MRMAVIYFAEKKTEQLKSLSEAAARGLESQGHSVDIYNASDFNRKLAIFQAVVIITEPSGGFGGKIPEGFGAYLQSVGPLLNLKSFAFVCKGMRSQKSLLTLMKIMEAEGMYVLYSDVLNSGSAAEAACAKIILH